MSNELIKNEKILCMFFNCDDIVVAIELVSLFKTDKNR